MGCLVNVGLGSHIPLLLSQFRSASASALSAYAYEYDPSWLLRYDFNGNYWVRFTLDEGAVKMSTLTLLIQDDADVAQGVAILRGDVPVPQGTDTIQLFVAQYCQNRSRFNTPSTQRVCLQYPEGAESLHLRVFCFKEQHSTVALFWSAELVKLTH